MKYRRLGRTEFDVSELVFACGETAGMMTKGEDDIMKTAVRRAMDAGINWFDTAPKDGDGASERNLGRVLKELGERPKISTKVWIDPGNTGDIPGAIERSVHESLERLQIDRIDLLQLHNGVSGASGGAYLSADQVLGRVGAVVGMETMRDQKLIKWIGMTALGDTGLCLRMMESKRFDTAQVYYNMINPTAAHNIPNRSIDQAMPKASRGQDFTGVLDACRQYDMGVIVIRALAAGVIVGNSDGYESRIITRDTDVADVSRKAKALSQLFEQEESTMAQSAIRFCLSHPQVTCVNYSIGELRHLEDGLTAVELGGFDRPVLDNLHRLYQSDFGAKAV